MTNSTPFPRRLRVTQIFFCIFLIWTLWNAKDSDSDQRMSFKEGLSIRIQRHLIVFFLTKSLRLTVFTILIQIY